MYKADKSGAINIYIYILLLSTSNPLRLHENSGIRDLPDMLAGNAKRTSLKHLAFSQFQVVQNWFLYHSSARQVHSILFEICEHHLNICSLKAKTSNDVYTNRKRLSSLTGRNSSSHVQFQFQQHDAGDCSG